MKLISWNVNGLRAAVEKGFAEPIRDAGRRCILPAGDKAPAAARSTLDAPGLPAVLVLC